MKYTVIRSYRYTAARITCTADDMSAALSACAMFLNDINCNRVEIQSESGVILFNYNRE